MAAGVIGEASAAETGAPAGNARRWRTLTMRASLVMVVAIAGGGIFSGPDPMFLGFAAVYGVAALLIWKAGAKVKVGAIAFALVLTVLLGSYLVPGLVFLATHPVSILTVDGVSESLSGVASIVLVVAAIAALLETRAGFLTAPFGPRAIAALAVAAFVALLALGATARIGAANQTGQVGDLSLQMKDFKFSAANLEAGRDVAIDLKNQDGAYHTFTIDGVVDRTLLANSEARITLHLTPGTYRYYCAVPGHAESMHGTLTVR
jgi:uncharacterized cupredoxin-like copper-binding protein